MVAAAAWWRGTRGEWYVVVQIVLVVLIAASPPTWNGWPDWPFPGGRLVSLAGLALLVGGAGLAVGGGLKLGAALTPLPHPAAGAVLQETGVYRVVRHPMYCGVILAAFGWALLRHGWLTLGYALAGWVFIEAKVRQEERWLLERFPGYAAYQRRVRKLIPFVY
jgi:protein-S-isoprenylcysteine O-methyltransferase Ste14